jgi:hypothetical protein
MGRVVHPVASGEPAWAGAVLKIPRRCMGRLRGFGLSGAALFFTAKLLNTEFPMKDKYEVGYGKPPKASRFGARPQPNRSSKSGLAREAAISVAAAINRPMKVTKRGATVRMHPHEAQMHGLAKNGLLGKLRAMREFYLECKKAGLLDAPPARQTSGVITVPKGVPIGVAARLVRMAGPPPWDNNLYDQCMAEYERDCENIERLEAKARADAEAK